MASILYLIASHKNPDQIKRLVNSLRRNSANSKILIHHDHSQSNLHPKDFEYLENVFIFENPIPVKWGEFSMVQFELNCFQWLKKNRIDFDWLILLSGQDYPLFSSKKIEDFLSQTNFDAFLEYFPAEAPPSSQWNWHDKLGFERYFFRYFTVSPLLRPLFYKLYRVVNWQPFLRVKAGRFGAKVAVKSFSHPFNSNFKCFAGSQWHTLSHKCVEYIIDFIDKNPKVIDHYRHTLIPDESFFQTVLVNNTGFSICDDNLRYISWEPPYPAIMKFSDYERLIKSEKFFARKFDASLDIEILDLLDQHMNEVTEAEASNL